MSSSYLNIPNNGSPSWKDPVSTQAALPSSGNLLGDARVTNDTQAIYIWSGSAWVQASGGGGGSGNVVGPSSSVSGDISLFADTTGKLLSDSNINVSYTTSPNIATIITIPNTATATHNTDRLLINGANRSIGTTETAGTIILTGGTSSTAGGTGGGVALSGGAFTGTGGGQSGGVSIAGAGNSAGSAGCQGVSISGGSVSGSGAGAPGPIIITAGAAGSGSSAAGRITLTSGGSTGASTLASGAITMATGNVTNNASASGAITGTTGTVVGGGTSGAISFTSANNTVTTGGTGAVSLTTGNVTNAGNAGNVGALTLTAGTNAGSGTKGVINLNSNGANRVQLDGSGNLQLLSGTPLLFDGSSSGSVSIVAPSTVTSYSLILPGAQGSVNTILQNDGSGNLSWSTIPQTISAEVNTGTSGSTKTITFSASSPAQLLTLSADCTITLAGGQSGGAYVLRIVQDSTPRTVTWANAKWPGATPPTISTGSGAVDLINFYCDGTNYYGTFAQAFA